MTVSYKTFEPSIALLEVDRPDRRNAIGWETMQAFGDQIERAYSQPELRALIISGSRHTFISGGDLKELAGFPSEADGLRLSETMTSILNRLEALPCPTIAAINGPARGGGVEICLACDLRIMSSAADLGLVQIKLGLTPGWGAGQRLLRLVGYSRTLEWLATGRILSPEEALHHGVINQIAPPGEALSTAIKLAQSIAAQPIQSVRAIKRLLRAGLFLSPGMAQAQEQSEFPPLWASESHLEAVQRFLDRK